MYTQKSEELYKSQQTGSYFQKGPWEERVGCGERWLESSRSVGCYNLLMIKNMKALYIYLNIISAFKKWHQGSTIVWRWQILGIIIKICGSIIIFFNLLSFRT